MYKPKLSFRRKAETGGRHDGRGLVRCCDMERCRSSPPEDASCAVVPSSGVPPPLQASELVLRSHHRRGRRSQSRPERARTTAIQFFCLLTPDS